MTKWQRGVDLPNGRIPTRLFGRAACDRLVWRLFLPSSAFRKRRRAAGRRDDGLSLGHFFHRTIPLRP